MASNGIFSKSTPKQMTDSWIVIDEHDESEFVFVDTEHYKTDEQSSLPKTKCALEGNKISTNSQALLSSTMVNNKQQNKKRKWKVLYSLPSTSIQTNVHAANLDSYVMDQYEQLFDKRDLFTSQHCSIKVK